MSARFAYFDCTRGGRYRARAAGSVIRVEIWQSHASEWRDTLTLGREDADVLASVLRKFVEAQVPA